MKTTKYQYVVNNGDLEDGFEIDSIWDMKERLFEYVAQDAAEDYHNNHDGWESSWPVDITLFHDGKEIGKFSVDMETVPAFYATKKKD